MNQRPLLQYLTGTVKKTQYFLEIIEKLKFYCWHLVLASHTWAQRHISGSVNTKQNDLRYSSILQRLSQTTTVIMSLLKAVYLPTRPFPHMSSFRSIWYSFFLSFWPLVSMEIKFWVPWKDIFWEQVSDWKNLTGALAFSCRKVNPTQFENNHVIAPSCDQINWNNTTPSKHSLNI